MTTNGEHLSKNPKMTKIKTKNVASSALKISHANSQRKRSDISGMSSPLELVCESHVK